jgi:hypothetical protein
VKTDHQPGGLGTGLGLGTDAQPGQDHGQKSGGEPGDELTARFERLLAGEADEPRLRFPVPPTAGPAAPAWAGRAAGPAGTAAGPPGSGLDRLVEEVAERMLVSDPRFDARGEVRIKVKDSVFPGLEVRLQQIDGKLQVEMVVAQAGDLVVLQREAPRLLQGLRERLGREVALRLSIESPDGVAQAGEAIDLPDDPATGAPTLPRGPAG